MSALTAGLAFHPEDPSLLAGGAFNGDVLLWNLAASEDKLARCARCCKAPRRPHASGARRALRELYQARLAVPPPR